VQSKGCNEVRSLGRRQGVAGCVSHHVIFGLWAGGIRLHCMSMCMVRGVGIMIVCEHEGWMVVRKQIGDGLEATKND